MASFTSILSNIGNGLKKFFGVAVTVAQAAEPIVAVAFPGLSGLFNTTVNEIAKVEGLAIAAGSQTGTGAQKLALVIQAIETEYNTFAAKNGVTYNPANVEAWVNAIVASLNAIPAPQPQS
jgi:hypothetical protein